MKREFKTEKRLNKIINTLKNRQQSLHVVIENVHDPHNVSAIFRSCDAVGVPEVSLLYTVESFPKISNVSSSSAAKWVEKKLFNDVEKCYSELKNKGFKIYASMLDENAISLFDIDFTEKVAIVVGNEHRGVSEEAAELADARFYIPMMGMVQSLNVSVATAVSLYEAQRQRLKNQMYEKSEMNEEQINSLIDEWCKK